MNDSINVDAITQTRNLIASIQIYREDDMVLFHQHGALLLQAIYQCLDLRDLVNPQLNWLTRDHVEQVVGINSTQIDASLHWCAWAQTAWFSKAFHMVYEQSWQKQVAVHLSTYLFPIISFLNILSLILSLIGVNRLLKPYRCRHRGTRSHLEYDFVHIPATWPILTAYCWVAIACVLIIDLRGLIFTHLPSDYNPLNYDLGCRVMTYLRNVLRYTPTWLLSVMLVDRVIGEFCHLRRITRQPTPQLTVDDSNGALLPGPVSGETVTCGWDDAVPKSNRLIHHQSRTCCICAPIKDYMCVYRSPIWCADFDTISSINFKLNSEQNQQNTSELAQTRNDRPVQPRSEWMEVGVGRIGGYLLVGTTVSGICLINTHTIWLYEINRDWKRCMLSAGNSVILGEFYPYFTQVIQSFSPHAIQLCSLLLLAFVITRDSLVRRTPPLRGSDPASSSQWHTESSGVKRAFVQPTHVAIALSVISLLCEIPDHFLWLQSKLYDNTFPNLAAYNTTMTNDFSGCRLLTVRDGSVIRLRNSHLLQLKMLEMKSTLLLSMILQTWLYLRWIGTFPILLISSCHFRRAWSRWFRYCHHQFRLSNHFHIRVRKSRRPEPFTAENETVESARMGQSCSVAMCCCMCATEFHELTTLPSPVAD